MHKPLLSLCIPTYNRARYLEDCLRSIEDQIKKNQELSDLIEVVISDNGSSDNTYEVVEYYRPSFKHFRYSKNERNLGMDLNVLAVVKNATSKYCFYVGDDDILTEGALNVIISKIKDDAYDVVTIDSTNTGAEAISKDNPIPEKSFIEIDDFNDFYFKGYCKGIFCVLIFNREMWLDVVDTKNFLEFSIYYETVLHVTAKTSKKLLYIDYPLIYTRQDCRWVENGYELTTFINFNLLLEKMITYGFDRKRTHALLVKNSKKIILILLRAKGHGLTCNFENFKKIYTNLKTLSIVMLLLVSFIYFVPNKLIVFIRDTKKKILKQS